MANSHIQKILIINTFAIFISMITTTSNLFDNQRPNINQIENGVNYGNIFIPEDWMMNASSNNISDNFYANLSITNLRHALWDNTDIVIDGVTFTAKQRMQAWLDSQILESDFQQMMELGVKLLRLPTGYWNWITYPGDTGPNAPDEVQIGNKTIGVAQTMKNLQNMGQPQFYTQYFDRIFAYAEKYGIQILLDLHGLPGSQNGEEHSGVDINWANNSKRNMYFYNSEWNFQKALEAVQAMTQYGNSKGATFFGVEPMNEAQFQNTADGHRYLAKYYSQCKEAVHSIKRDANVVFFEWTFNMAAWEENYFQNSDSVIWDTHLYHGGDFHALSNISEALQQAFKDDFASVKQFRTKQNNSKILIGEWTLGLFSLNLDQCNEAAQFLIQQFEQFGLGSCYWTFKLSDASPNYWSMQYLSGNYSVDGKQEPIVQWNSAPLSLMQDQFQF